MTEDRQRDFWKRVKERDALRDFDETGKERVRPGQADSDVIPDPNALRPLPSSDGPDEDTPGF
jgi:hypothetical protein